MNSCVLFGVAGTAAGSLFSLTLSLVYARRRLEELRAGRVGLWAMGGAVALAFAALTVGGGRAVRAAGVGGSYDDGGGLRLEHGRWGDEDCPVGSRHPTHAERGRSVPRGRRVDRSESAWRGVESA